MTLLHDYGYFAVLFQYLDSDGAAVSFHEEADAVVLDAQIANRKLRNALRQVRTIEDHAPFAGIDGDPKAGLQDHEDRTCSPRLWRAGNRVKGRSLAFAAIDTADEFGEAMEFDRAAEVEEAHQDTSGEFTESVTGHAGRDDRIVVWPDGTVMIRERVVAGFVTADCADTPSAEKVVADQRVRDQVRALRAHNAGVEAVAGI